MGIEFNRIITLLRKERGITQKQAAQDLGISQAQLSHYENVQRGKRELHAGDAPHGERVFGEPAYALLLQEEVERRRRLIFVN